MQIINQILNKLKNCWSSDEQNVDEQNEKPKRVIGKIRYNKHGFPTYQPRIKSDSKSKNRFPKY